MPFTHSLIITSQNLLTVSNPSCISACGCWLSVPSPSPSPLFGTEKWKAGLLSEFQGWLPIISPPPPVFQRFLLIFQPQFQAVWFQKQQVSNVSLCMVLVCGEGPGQASMAEWLSAFLKCCHSHEALGLCLTTFQQVTWMLQLQLLCQSVYNTIKTFTGETSYN